MQELHELPLSRQRALISTIALSFVLLLASAVLVIDLSNSAEEADAAVLNTLQVKGFISEINTLVNRTESSLRGYLLTADPALLEPYRESHEPLRGALIRLRASVGDNPPQVTRVDELGALIERRAAAIEEALRLHAASNPAAASAVMRDRGDPLMSDFHAHIQALDQVQSDLLIDRQQTVATNRARFFQAVAAMLISCGVLALFGLTSVRRYLATLESSRALLRDQNRQLERRVHERTLEHEQAAATATRERTRAEALLTDVNHRVGNNLALVSSFLTMQLRAVTHPEAAKALEAARARVQVVAAAHRKLRLGADFATVRANEVLAAVIEDIASGLSPSDRIKIDHHVAPLEINARDAVSLGVLTSELVMNAVKHAFAAGDTGLVTVKLDREGSAAPYLEVADDGIGMSEKPKSAGGGLGTNIVDMLARQFGGRLERVPAREHADRPGTRIRVDLNNLQVVEHALQPDASVSAGR
jgi:two-component sensor histidine kinase/CHASE3 domain sensor protein